MEIPTRVGPMREAIILALARLHDQYPEDRGHFRGDMQAAIALMAGSEQSADWTFDIRSLEGKAFDRAFAQLREEGIVVANPDDPNNIEFTLAIFERATDGR